MTADELHFVVPGPLEQLTGGYVYDARMVEGLRTRGRRVRVHNLAGTFPDPDAVARAALRDVLASLPEGAPVVVDGLAMGGLPEVLEEQASRLRVLSLLHHPLAEETGLPDGLAARFRASERRALAACAGVVVSSAFTARALVAYGVAPERVRVVVPGTDRAPLAVGPQPGEPPALLCVASVTPRKGHDVLVAALERTLDVAWTCICAGSLERDRAHADSVLHRAAHAGLSGRIDFVGERHGEALAALYHNASVFVLPSHYEGYGMVLADALVRGLPVVSTRGGAIPFTVPADAGILVEPGDAVAFAHALRTMLDPDTGLREERASAAARHGAALPTWEQAAAAFASAVDELLG